MKVAEMKGCTIHVLAQDHTMIICEPDAVFIRCTLCGEVKSVHMLTDDNRSLPWMRQCVCNAPHSGGDTQPLEEPEPAMPLDQPRTIEEAADALYKNAAFRARLVERDS